jgi:hypothetical protein
VANRDVRRLVRWRAHSKAVGERLKLLEGRVGRHIGEAYGATFDGYRASWPTIHAEEKEISFTREANTYRGALTISPLKDAK